MSKPGNLYSQGTGEIDWRIFIPSILIILLVSVPLIVNPKLGQSLVNASFNFVTDKFGWLAMLVSPVSIVFLAWLALSPYGRIKLGRPEDKPEFTTLTWIAILFCCGVGSSILVWGVAEPIYYIDGPPLGLEPRSVAAYSMATALPTFHWGISGWAIYGVAAVVIAYSMYVRREPRMRMSQACSPVLGRYTNVGLGPAIEVLVVVGTIGGFGTSLGLGVPFVTGFVAKFLGVAESPGLSAAILVVWTGFFGASVYFGLEKGMKLLTQINVWMVLALLLFILFAGPTLFIIDNAINSLGLLISNFVNLSFSLEPYNFKTVVDETAQAVVSVSRTGGFPQWWSVFYWFWFLALMPISGLFIARCSKGRTIRELVFGILVWCTLGCWVILSILGGYTLFLQKTGLMDVAAVLAESNPGVTAAAVMFTLPGQALMTPIYALLAIIFLATTLDSASYSLASICTKELTGYEQPARGFRLFWAIVIGSFAVGILLTAGLEPLRTIQSSSVVLGLPLVIAWFIMLWSITLYLRQDFGPRLLSKIECL